MRAWALTVFVVFQFALAAGDSRPNIVVIMADDMGYSDLGCYGGEIATPNLDRLAQNGLRFTRFYNNAKCEPTRASLLTGKYSQQVGASPSVVYGSPTFGEVLRPAGYRTLMVGKWHAGQKPFDRGFDRHFGLTDGCCNYFNPGNPRDGEPKPSEKNFPRRWAIDGQDIRPYTPDDKNFYSTDAFTNYACQYLDEYKNETQPFILYAAYTAPHYPLHAWPEDIARYRGKYMKGWDAMREERFKRQLAAGLFPAGTRLTPRDTGVPAWDSLSQEEKEAWDLRMSVYAAMVDRLDQNVGRLLRKLEEVGKAQNTLIVFLSDNGAEASDLDLSNVKGTPPGPLEGYRSLGKPWANACNTPFRRYKTFDHEGGVCTPFIAYWPNVIKPGTLTTQSGHIIDLLPTFAELANASYPAQWQNAPLAAPAGRSLLPILKGEQRPAAPIFWEFGSAAAVHLDGWKLVRAGKKEDAWELYDLNADRTEMNDLAKIETARRTSLLNLWENWNRNVGEKKKR